MRDGHRALSWTQMVMAANSPMLTKASLVDGRVESGIMPTGQAVGVIDDLPSCAELIERIIAEAEASCPDSGRSMTRRRPPCSTVPTPCGRRSGWISEPATGSSSPPIGCTTTEASTGDRRRADRCRAARSCCSPARTCSCPEIVRVDGFAMGVNYGVDSVRFPAAGPGRRARMRGTAMLVEVDELPTGLQTLMRITIETDGSASRACVIDSLSRWFP